MKNQLFLDFEFANLTGPTRKILCVAWQTGMNSSVNSVWLTDREKRKTLAHDLAESSKDHTFIAYTDAEAYCLLQLWDEFGCHPESFEYYDLYLEYRMLTNHNHALAYGPQLIDGSEIVTTPPRNKWAARREETKDQNKHHRPQHSLASACYKVLGIKIDTEHKNKMRDLIIADKPLTDGEKKDILDYCASDVEYLPQLYARMGGLLCQLSKEKDRDKLRREILLRGDYAIRTARMTMLGYPIDESTLRKFSGATDLILKEAQREINELHPEVAPFQWNKKAGRYIQKTKKITDWIEEQDFPTWERTEKGELSIKKDAFGDYFSSESSGFGGAFYRYLKTRQSLNGFLPRAKDSKRANFWDSLGEDGRIHPSFGIYGAQSGRSQPKAVSYLLLKAHWMRAFIKPPKYRAIVAIDYSSQEFLISALLSEDNNMIKAYESGDPYLYFAKLDGAVPKTGTKESHAHERSIYKTVVLGISYLMGPKGLAAKLTNDLGKPYTEEQAKTLIEAFQDAFPDFAAWQKDYIETYLSKGNAARAKLPCGWYMWSDNKNSKSVGNYPIQGFGSSIMRKAVSLAQDRGLDVILTLHDALYVEYYQEDLITIDILHECMSQAFAHYFKKARIKKRANCRLDIFTWGDGFKKGTGFTPLGKTFECNNIYLDKRGEKEYFKYLKYFS
jgi:hypothetical protein